MSTVDHPQVLRDGNSVRRFHTVRVLEVETVGHHSANVALLCDWLLEGKASAELMKMALHHDLAEQWVGDVPAPAKWASGALADAHRALENGHLLACGLYQHPLTEDERSVLKAADMLDLVLKAQEEIALGNRAMYLLLGRGMEYLDGLHLPQAVRVRVTKAINGGV